MDYVKSFNLFGTDVRQIPCIRGSGAPTTETVSAVGDMYMDTDTGAIYKCTAVTDGACTWENIGAAVATDVNNVYPFIEKSLITRQTINSGVFSTSYSRLANTKPMVFNNDVIIKCEPGYKFEVNFWSDATADKSAWLSCEGWLTENYKVSAGTYFSLLIAKTDNSTIQISDYDKVKIYRAADFAETDANTLELENLAVELSSAIGDAKQAITFSNGSWSVTSNGNGGTYVRRVTNATRFASDRAYVFSKDVKISMPDYSKGSAYIVIVTDTDTMTTVSQSGWITKEYTVPANSPFVIEVKSLDSGYTIDDTLADLQMFCVDSLTDISQRVQVLENGEEPTATETAKYKEFASLFNNSGVAEPFIYFTDPHYVAVGEDADWRPGYLEHLSVIKRHFDNTSAGFVLCGGDWLLSGNTKVNACYMLSKIKAKMREMFNKFHLVAGNHDTNYLGIAESGSAANTGRLTQQALCNLWYGEHGKSYYSFNGSNTKFYVFDCGIDSGHTVLNDLDNEQIGYFVEKLKNNDDKYIALTAHIVNTEAGVHPLTNRLTEIASIYNSRGTVTHNDVEYDFSQKTGKIEFLIAGHTHADLTGTLNGIPYIQTTNASVSANYPTFDYVFVDYTARKLKTVRVGDGENREIDLV